MRKTKKRVLSYIFIVFILATLLTACGNTDESFTKVTENEMVSKNSEEKQDVAEDPKETKEPITDDQRDDESNDITDDGTDDQTNNTDVGYEAGTVITGIRYSTWTADDAICSITLDTGITMNSTLADVETIYGAASYSLTRQALGGGTVIRYSWDADNYTYQIGFNDGTGELVEFIIN